MLVFYIHIHMYYFLSYFFHPSGKISQVHPHITNSSFYSMKFCLCYLRCGFHSLNKILPLLYCFLFLMNNFKHSEKYKEHLCIHDPALSNLNSHHIFFSVTNIKHHRYRGSPYTVSSTFPTPASCLLLRDTFALCYDFPSCLISILICVYLFIHYVVLF